MNKPAMSEYEGSRSVKRSSTSTTQLTTGIIIIIINIIIKTTRTTCSCDEMNTRSPPRSSMTVIIREENVRTAYIYQQRSGLYRLPSPVLCSLRAGKWLRDMTWASNNFTTKVSALRQRPIRPPATHLNFDDDSTLNWSSVYFFRS